MSNYKYFDKPIKAKSLFQSQYSETRDKQLSFEPLQLNKTYNIIGEYIGCFETFWILENKDLCSKEKMKLIDVVNILDSEDK